MTPKKIIFRNSNKAQKLMPEEDYLNSEIDQNVPLPFIRLYIAIINQAIMDQDSKDSSIRASAIIWLYEKKNPNFSLKDVLFLIGREDKLHYIRKKAIMKQII